MEKGKEKEKLVRNQEEDLKEVREWAYRRSAEEVLRALKVDPNTGLSREEASIRLAKFGRNELPQIPPPAMFEQILEQFKDNLVRILLVSACVSFFIALTDKTTDDWTAFVEPAVILLILIANATIGVWQEMKSEKALDALLVMQANTTQVLREGKLETIDAAELVPGDICILRGGDKVPADLRLLRVMALTVDQSALTGETKRIRKKPDDIIDDPNAVISQKSNMLWSSSAIETGEATGVVSATGESSQLGVIRQKILEASEENKKTPLKQRLDDFGDVLGWIILGICGLSWVINIHNFFDPIHGNPFRGAIYYFKIAVSLAVAAIPEGLPAVITTCLALATARMAEKKAIVRQLSSVETLGCTTVICSDKTGTLTVNKMTVAELSWVSNDGRGMESSPVRGGGLELQGQVEKLTKEEYNKNEALQDVARVCALCNDARLEKRENDPGVSASGSATEIALRVLTQKLAQYAAADFPNDPTEVEPYARLLGQETPVLAKLPFTQTRKCMSVIVQRRDGRKGLLLKGAPEMLLDKCVNVKLPNGECIPLTSELKETIKRDVQEASKKALRCLAFAVREDVEGVLSASKEKELALLTSEEDKYKDLETEATFVGYVGIRDPPRSNVARSIAECRRAGIQVIMITGDNQDTAVAIAKEIGLVSHHEQDPSQFIDGREFATLPISDLVQRIEGGAVVFSRVEHTHKRTLVQILKDMHHIVAMTGDGVNDAAAIRLAHIGIAMGISGTAVAKEASKLVLADDNFGTIVLAVEEGRGIYSNIQAFIRYLLSSNIGEVVAIFVTSALGFPEVLSSVHLLWVNLVTDGLPATALGFNPPEPDVMSLKPRPSNEPIISGWTFVRYFVIGTYVGLATILIFVHWFLYMESEDQHTLVSWTQLTSWSECPDWPADQKRFHNVGNFDLTQNPCDYFRDGKEKASTLSLTVLVVIEMFNALNALSEHSLLKVPPWKNPWLCLAICSSMTLHFMILYIPVFRELFGVTMLTASEWMWVLIYSFPIIIIDEILKLITHCRKSPPAKLRDPKLKKH